MQLGAAVLISLSLHGLAAALLPALNREASTKQAEPLVLRLLPQAVDKPLPSPPPVSTPVFSHSHPHSHPHSSARAAAKKAVDRTNAPPVPAPTGHEVAQPRSDAPVVEQSIEPPAKEISASAVAEAAAPGPSADPPSLIAGLPRERMSAPAPSSAGGDSFEPPHFNVAYLNNPQPEYPPAAKRLRLQGTVILRVMVGRTGGADELNILRSSGSPLLDEAALRAVRGWRFLPARRGNEAVAHWADVPIRFVLKD